MTPALSVLLPVYRPHATYLTSAIDSILQQSWSDFELLIVEAHSEINVRDIYTLRDPRLRYFSFEGNASIIDQLNYGIAQAKSDLVARMDADDWSHPDRFQRQIAYLERHPEINVLGTQIDLMDEKGTLLGSRRYPTEPNALARTLPGYNPLAHPSVIFRKHAVVKAGGYRQFYANEDYELWCRLSRSGYQMANLPDTLLRYRIHQSSTKSQKLKKLLRGTRMVKRLYFADTMTLPERARYWGEGLLLNLPGPWIMWLFQKLQYRRESME